MKIRTFLLILAVLGLIGAIGHLFVRNSENGRRTLFSSSNVSEMADRITSHMAHEIVRRERHEAALLEPSRKHERLVDEEPASGSGMGIVIAAFVIGLITGGAGLFTALWLSIP